MRALVIINLAVFVIALSSGFAQAQVVTAPTTASFAYTDAQLAQATGFLLEDFQCASLVAGVCTGQAAAPFQTGATVPVANVTTLNPVDSFGNNRSVNLLTAPGNGLLASLPAGMPFIATATALADPTTGLSNSPRSAASNPFFATAVPLAVPANTKLKR